MSLCRSEFFLRKMQTVQAETVQYTLGGINLNQFLGSEISLQFTGQIQCIHCAREIKKTFFDGYCYPCFQSLARCDMCILKPELCHHSKGTCREPAWAAENCLIPHLVYISLTSGLKVGITRLHKKFERWIDQGAVEAIELAIVPERLVAGLVEVTLAGHISDKTDWRHLILGKIAEIDLTSERENIAGLMSPHHRQYLISSKEAGRHTFCYPVLKHPDKVRSHNFDKEPLLSGTLNGIKGQYLFVGEKVVNIRKYAGYQVGLIH